MMRVLALIGALALVSVHAAARTLPVQRMVLSGRELMAQTPPSTFDAQAHGVVPTQVRTRSRRSELHNSIELTLRNHSQLDASFVVMVGGELTYQRVDSAKPVTVPFTLRIEWTTDREGRSVTSSVHPFSNAYVATLRFTRIDVTTLDGVPKPELRPRLAPFIELALTFQEERYTAIDVSIVPAAVSACADASTDELVLSWTAHQDAEEYELEYTFVDDYTAQLDVARDMSTIPYDFRANSTRVRVPSDYYRLPLVYERGYILYRVRTIGRGGEALDRLVYGRWSGGSERGVVSAFPHKYYHNRGHVDDAITWQISSSFAEEGKRSDVVRYFDGTLRDRQTVSAANLEVVDGAPHTLPSFHEAPCLAGGLLRREVIARETVYDLQGRPAASIMAAPTNHERLEFIPHLNISAASGKPYNWTDFDGAAADCRAPRPLSEAYVEGSPSGAATYYSPNNPVKFGANAFLPRADGYPFSVTRYTQDNTGRIAAQSGVGATFQFGQRHETRYTYGRPEQPELDRLFGTEVGDASRYRKNTVMDANGQITVSYLNPEGKTIATALAGAAPASLQALPSNATRPDSARIGNLSRTGNSRALYAESHFNVENDRTLYTFFYGLNPQSLLTEDCNGAPLCLDCIYDLEIRLTHVESCTSEPLFHYTGTIGALMDPEADTVDLVCDNTTTTGDYPRSFERTLDIGSYVLTKTLTVNEAAAQAYVERAFRDTCIAKRKEIEGEVMREVDTLDCYTSCTECPDPPVSTPECDTRYCLPTPNRCDITRGQMLADVTPGGQYAEFVIAADGTVDPSPFPTSILNGLDVPSLFSEHELNDVTALVGNWRPEFAEVLLPRHPESCMLAWCAELPTDASLDFDQHLLSTMTFQEAAIRGYAQTALPLASIPVAERPSMKLLAIDPWFANGANLDRRQALEAKLAAYGCEGQTRIIDELAMELAYCANSQPLPALVDGAMPQIDPSVNACSQPDGYPSTHQFGIDATVGTIGPLNDLEWHFLRTLYLAAKSEIVDADLAAFASEAGCTIPTDPSKLVYFGPQTDRMRQEFAEEFTEDGQPLVSADASLCEFIQAVRTNIPSINARLDAICDDTAPEPCTIDAALATLLNLLLPPLDSGRIRRVSPSQIPAELASAGVNGAMVRRVGNTLRIDLLPCTSPILIPLPEGKVPASVTSVTDLVCSATGCTFTITIRFTDGTSSTMSATTDCTLLACPDDASLDRPSSFEWYCNGMPQMQDYPAENQCVKSLLETAQMNIELRYRQWVATAQADLLERYYERCLGTYDSLDIKFQSSRYHFTLYYYDQAGNLVRTVPPAGVKPLTDQQVAAVDVIRASGSDESLVPEHAKASVYRFNTLNQIVWQRTPDAGITIYLYDGLGRIVASQNAQQRLDGNVYAYSRYDRLGRLVEGGKITSAAITPNFARNFTAWTDLIDGHPTREEIVLTQFDAPFSPTVSQKFGGEGQRNLRNRVASALRFESASSFETGAYSHATHYSYDIAGNVHTLIQDYPNTPIGDKKLVYDYDLQSGKVNATSYQAGFDDQFHHRYRYDALNRLTKVQTSENGHVWETDAEYFYYRHGPLARLELGTDKVQGLDYMYTLQGWIKGVNGVTDSPETDMGQDGIVRPVDGSPVEIASIGGIAEVVYTTSQLYSGVGYGALHHPVARDAYGYVLDYFPGDYRSIAGNDNLTSLEQQSGTVHPLYNGNISRMYTQISLPNEEGVWDLSDNGFNYRYDQLNRLTEHDAWSLDRNGLMAMLPNEAYKGRLSYDADGNILTSLRNGTAEQPAMDDLTYHYYLSDNVTPYNPAVGVPLNATNRLAYVDDRISSVAGNSGFSGQAIGNFGYDAAGGLTRDAVESITSVEWDARRRITRIHKQGASSSIAPSNFEIARDALGNRVARSMGEATTYYVRDGAGNVICTYVDEKERRQIAKSLYGYAHLGVAVTENALDSEAPPTSSATSRGRRTFFLANHIQNILVFVSDRKLATEESGAVASVRYSSTVRAVRDYYPFGMILPSRDVQLIDVVRGFNGQETDDEIKGRGNSVAFEAREYDPRLGIFWSVDPLASSYPGFSSYQYNSNSPIWIVDVGGMGSLDDPQANYETGHSGSGTVLLRDEATGYSVNIGAKSGVIVVQEGDWLSKYHAALTGSTDPGDAAEAFEIYREGQWIPFTEGVNSDRLEPGDRVRPIGWSGTESAPPGETPGRPKVSPGFDYGVREDRENVFGSFGWTWESGPFSGKALRGEVEAGSGGTSASFDLGTLSAKIPVGDGEVNVGISTPRAEAYVLLGRTTGEVGGTLESTYGIGVSAEAGAFSVNGSRNGSGGGGSLGAGAGAGGKLIVRTMPDGSQTATVELGLPIFGPVGPSVTIPLPDAY